MGFVLICMSIFTYIWKPSKVTNIQPQSCKSIVTNSCKLMHVTELKSSDNYNTKSIAHAILWARLCFHIAYLLQILYHGCTNPTRTMSTIVWLHSTMFPFQLVSRWITSVMVACLFLFLVFYRENIRAKNTSPSNTMISLSINENICMHSQNVKKLKRWIIIQHRLQREKSNWRYASSKYLKSWSYTKLWGGICTPPPYIYQ